METYFDNMAPEGASDRLLRDVKDLREAAEDLVKATASNLAEKSRHEVNQAIARLKKSCTQIEATTISGARRTDRLLREHPYPSIGLAFGIGLLLGFWVNRAR